MITDIFGWMIIRKFTHVKPGELLNTAFSDGRSNTEAAIEPVLFILLFVL